MAQRSSSLAFGLVLVLLGVWFLVVQFIPGLQNWFRLEMTWPLIIVGVAVLIQSFFRLR